jgi:Xaa-Pro aminopeptidase
MWANILLKDGLDGLLISQPENVRYLSGFTSPEDAQVLLSPRDALLITDGRYTVQAQEESRIPVRIVGRSERWALLAERLQGRVGFEADHLSYAQVEALREQPNAELVPTRGLIEGLRRKKQPEELEKIRKAAELTDRGFQHILSFLKPGVRELDLALELEFFLRREGSEPISSMIVASGVRGAMPHGAPSTKVIQEGELVTFDFAARIEGYTADMTRTVAVGTVNQELRRIYQAVWKAEEAALAAVAPGMACRELDALARKVLEGYGLASAFTHSLGHGVGLAIHEAPSLSSSSEDVLEAGMVITIEPGVYLPGIGGVRIEDLVEVSDQGPLVLSKSPKAFQSL